MYSSSQLSHSSSREATYCVFCGFVIASFSALWLRGETILSLVSCKGDVGNAILDTKSKIVLALFSVCNKQTGVT